MLRHTFLAALSILLACCNNKKATPESQINATNSTATTELSDALTSNQSTLNMLQGKWVHVVDTTNYLVFEKNLRKEIAAGMSYWDSEEFVIADQCLNESDKNNNTTLEKEKYISCPKSDLCWHIVDVNKNTLELTYVGRGNTLTYNRANE